MAGDGKLLAPLQGQEGPLFSPEKVIWGSGCPQGHVEPPAWPQEGAEEGEQKAELPRTPVRIDGSSSQAEPMEGWHSLISACRDTTSVSSGVRGELVSF